MLAAPPPKRVEPPSKGFAEPQREILPEPSAAVSAEPAAPAAQDNSPPPAAEAEPVAAPSSAPPPKPESPPVVAGPLFRARQDIPKAPLASIPAVIPIVRAPDDPGIDDEATDEFSEQIAPPTAQAGGWRGFLSRWGS